MNLLVFSSQGPVLSNPVQDRAGFKDTGEMRASEEKELIKRLDGAGGRNDEILALVDAGWPYPAIHQVLGIPGRSAVSGVVKRCREKRKKVAA